MAVKGKAVLIVALALVMAGAPVQANSTGTRLVIPQGLELSEQDLAGVEGSAARTPGWLTQLHKVCTATPQASAACTVIAFTGGLLVAAFDHESREVLAAEFIRPWWEPLFARPLRECGAWGWRCF